MSIEYTVGTMDQLEAILAQHVPGQHWRITRPLAGVQKEAYIAQNEQYKLFVKFDAATPAWTRLAAIGVTPPVIATGTHAGRPYLIQVFVEGVQPDRVWLTRHIPAIARLIRRYHSDQPLAELLSVPHAQSYADHIHQEVATLEQAIARPSGDSFKTDHFRQVFARFREQSSRLQPVPLVPTHADPSPVNLLVTRHGLTMLDWDEVLLSDPMRDIGLIVWWYLPASTWPAFFAMYGAPIDRDRLFWWVAKRSLELALWLDARHADDPAQAFLDDFYRAVAHQHNPQVFT